MTTPIPSSRSQAAQLKRCSASTITRALLGALSACALPNGDVDVGHDLFKRWQPSTAKIREQKKNETAPNGTVAQRLAAESEVEVPPDFNGLMQLSFAEICMKWGSLRGLEKALVAKRLACEITRLQLKNRRDSRRVYSAWAVDSYIIGLLTRLRLGIFRVASKTLVARVAMMTRAGEPIEEANRVARDILDGEFRVCVKAVDELLQSGLLFTRDIPTQAELKYLDQWKDDENDEDES